MSITVTSNNWYRAIGKLQAPYKSASSLGVAETERWCKNHPLGIWAPGFAKCTVGNRKQEECEEGKNDR